MKMKPIKINAENIMVDMELLLDGKPVDIDELKRALGRTEPCQYCKSPILNKDLPVKAGANGNMGAAALIADLGIVILQHNLSAGYFNIRYCPMCGRRLHGGVDDD